MPRSLSWTLVALALVAALSGALAGCGSSGDGGGDAAASQAAALQTAIEVYLREKNMDLAVVRLQDVSVQDWTASAAAVLKEREALHNVTVTWQFTFARPGTVSPWTVTDVKH